MHYGTDQSGVHSCESSLDVIAVYYVTLYSGALLRCCAAIKDTFRGKPPSSGFSKDLLLGMSHFKGYLFIYLDVKGWASSIISNLF